jgi:hypothetical protein
LRFGKDAKNQPIKIGAELMLPAKPNPR